MILIIFSYFTLYTVLNAFELPTSADVKIAKILELQSRLEIEHFQIARRELQNAEVLCAAEMQQNKLPLQCFEQVHWAERLGININSTIKEALSQTCLLRAAQQMDIHEIQRAKSHKNIGAPCMKIIRERENLILYKSEDYVEERHWKTLN